jgi:hypothetical protein
MCRAARRPRRAPGAANDLLGGTRARGERVARRRPAAGRLPPRVARRVLAPARERRLHRLSALRRTDRTGSPEHSPRDIGYTESVGAARLPGPVAAAGPRAAAPPVEAVADRRAGSRSSSRTGSGASSECRIEGTGYRRDCSAGVRTRSSAPPVGRLRRPRPGADSRNRGKTRGLPGCQRRSDRTSRADGTPLARTSQGGFC